MKLLLVSIAGILFTLWMGWGLYVIYTTERPPYKVIESLSSNVEIRQYEEQTWISTAYASDNASFPVLGSYIFGQNVDGAQIAMTAPVITDQRMSFILPTNMSKVDAPAPAGQAIEFTTVPARQLATLSFSWLTPPDRVARKTTELMNALQASGIRPADQPFLMRYNDPWTPPFLRRNEVAVEIRQGDR